MAQEIDITGLKKNFNTTVVGASVTVIAQLAVRTEFSRFYYAKDRVFEFNNRPVDAVNYLSFETPLVVTRLTTRLPLFGTNTNNAILVTGQSVLRAGTSTQVNSANTASLFIKGSNPIRLPINMYSGGVGTVNTFTDIQGQPNIYGVALITTATWAFAIEQLPASQTSGLAVNSIITVNTSSGNTGNFGTNNTAYVQAINTNQIIVIATSGTTAPVNGTIDGITNTGQTTFYVAPVQPLVAQYLIVGGGGGGGSDMGGGGGAGGYLAGSITLTNGTYSITVGAGGAGAPAGTSGPAGSNGNPTIALGFTALGGGGGASKHDAASYPAGSGGSGGGGSGGRLSSGSYGGSPGTGTAGQGNNGAGSGVTWYPGGGGGAGAAASQTGSEIGHGGIGISNSILGTAYHWAGGGGGAGYSNYGGNGGLGGGGGGAPRGGSTGLGGAGLNSGSNATSGGLNSQTNVPGGDAGANTGGGGGGGSHYNSNNRGGNGGSGIVVIRYPGPQRVTGGTVTTVGGDTVHAFTATGISTFIVGSGSALPTFRDPNPVGWVFTITNLASTVGYNVGDVISHVGRTGTLGSTSSLVYLTGINTASNSISGISFGTTAPKLGNINAVYSTGESLANVAVSGVSTSAPYTFVVSGLKSTSGLTAGSPGSVITATNAGGSFGAGNTVIVQAILGYTSLLAYVTSGTSVPIAGIVTNFTATGALVTLPVIGQVAYTTTGTYSWTAPAGITSVCVVAVGGGGGGSTVWSGGGGGAGGLGWKNNIAVTPGQTYTVEVGRGGPPTSNTTNVAAAGGTSYFISTATVAGYGGGTGGPNSTSFGGGYGGGYLGDSGGRGGNGAFQGSWNYGGAGAGGYSGNGADSNGGTGGVSAPTGSGGGAAGGYYSSTYGVPAGGGVGIFGRGADGTASGQFNGGGGGSGGEQGRGGEASGQQGPSIINGGAFGGGGGGSGTSYGGGWGGRGAVRIIWGSGRSFPVTLTADQGNAATLPTITTSFRNENVGGSSFVYPSSRIESIPLVIQQNNVPKIASLTITDSRRLVLQRQIISKTGSEFSLRNNNTPVTISLAVPGRTFSTGTVQYQLPLTIEPGGVGFIGTVTQLPAQPNIYGVAVANSSSWAFAIENLSSTQTSSLVVGRMVTANTSSDSTGNFGTNNTTWVYSIGVGFVVLVATGGSTAPVNGTIDRITITGQTYVSPIATTVDLLLVGGGGSGGNHNTTNANGGGGAGGLLYGSNVSISLGSHAVVIGQGGTAVANSTNANGNKGSSSTFGTTFIAHGGGGGVGSGVAYNAVVSNGGSGGGFAQANGGGGGPGLATQISYGSATGYGNAGGGNAQGWTGAGGGGAGTAGVGGSGGTAPAGDGGQGRAYDISGTMRWYAGGGGGGGNSSERAGDGYAGGGRGAGTTLRYNYNVYTAEVNSITTGSGTPNAIPNTGGGGGGGSYWAPNGGWGSGSGAGGSGIAIVRYLGGQSGSGGIITSANGYTIHTFTADGTFVFNGTSGLSIPSFRAPTQSPWTFAITGTSVVGFNTGSVLTALPRAGSFGSNNQVYVTSVDTVTNSINCFAWARGTFSTPPSSGLVNAIYPTGEFAVNPLVSSVTSAGPSAWIFTISNIRGTLLYTTGTIFTATSITGSLGTGSTVAVSSIDSFTQIKAYAVGGTTPIAGFIGNPVLSQSIYSLPQSGDIAYTTTGTYSWTAPAGVTSVCVVAVGGGGGGGSTWSSGGGGGGGLGWKNNISVTPGQSYTVVVGQGGASNANATTAGSEGGNSYFISLTTVAGYGGGRGGPGSTAASNGYGGGFFGDGGGRGGGGAFDGNWQRGGAGAGGYAGQGAEGVSSGGVNAPAGGGGASGGYYSSTYGVPAGGGVGIYGQGASGVARGQYLGGGGGSGGENGRGGEASGESGFRIINGGAFGGGGGGSGTSYGGGWGGRGAVRIIWGTGRAFPATNAGTLTSVVVVVQSVVVTPDDNIGGDSNFREVLMSVSSTPVPRQNTTPAQVLVNVDSSIRSTIKNFVHIPADTTNSNDYEMAPSDTRVINGENTGTYIYGVTPITTATWGFRIYSLSSTTVSTLSAGAIITANTSSGRTGSFGVGNTVSVFSVTNATSIVAIATGGSSAPVVGSIDTITATGGTSIYTPPSLTIDLLVVGGGGSGGNHNTTNGNGGGGAGGLLYGTGIALGGGSYVVTVGAGGVAIANSTNGNGNKGSSSTFGIYVAHGGGGGNGSGAGANAAVQNGGSGGGRAEPNGGGGSFGTSIQTSYTSPTVTGYGNSGGSSSIGWTGGGGGGAGSAGVGGSNGSTGGDGGRGLAFDISGTWKWYAGGGGGGGNSSERAGDGYAGGGRGHGTTSQYNYNNYPAQGTVNAATTGSATPNAIPNTGGGGGAGSYWASNGGWYSGSGSGGSGIVIVRYAGGQQASGGTVSSAGGNTIHTFTSVGDSTFSAGFSVSQIPDKVVQGVQSAFVAVVAVSSATSYFKNRNFTARLQSPSSLPNNLGIISNITPTGAPGPWTFALTNMRTTAEFSTGTVITATPITGSFGLNNTVRVLSITSSTEMVCLARSGDIAPSTGTVAYIQPTGAIDNGPIISNVAATGAGTWSFVVSNLTSTIMMQVGSIIVATTASGSLASFGTGTTAFVSSILNISQISAVAMGGTAPVAGIINNISTSGAVVTFNTGSYVTLTFVAGGNLSVTNNGTTDVTIFKTSGSTSWDNEARVAQGFTAPCTLEFFKQAANDNNGVSYSMMGWNDDPTANASYTTLDYTAYPYRTDAYSVHHNGSEVQYGIQWDPAKKFYIVYGTDGFIRHYNGTALLYSVSYGTGRTVYVDSSFYSPNGTFGGFSNIRVKTSAWQGSIGYGGQGFADYSIIRPIQILGRQDNWDNIVAVSMVNSLNRPVDYFGNENTEPTLVISNAATASMRNVVVPMFESGVNPGNITDITTVTSTTWSFTINGMRSTNGFTTGTIIFALAVVGTFGTGNQVTVTGITSSTAMTCITSFGTGMPRAGSITGIYATGELEPVSPYIEKVIGTNALTNTTSYSVSFSAANSSYLQYPNSTQFNLVGGAWTAECWIKPSGDYSIHNIIFCKRVTSSGTTSYEGYLRITTGVISFYNGTNYESNYTLTSNVWSHCAWVYTGSRLNIYVNGILQYSVEISLGANNTEPLLIGQARGYNEYFTGLISNFRLVKNIAVYTGPFTPPTSPLSTTQGETTNIAAISTNTFTSLLVCQTNMFTDRSIYSTATTIVGTPSISIDNPFGTQPIITGPWSYIISGLTSTNAFFGGAIITATTVAGNLGSIGTGTSYVNFAINNRQIAVINNTVGATVTPGFITAVSTSGVVTATSGPAASYQVAFNGTNQYLTTPSTANYNLSSGDFTVECWVYVTSNGNNTIFTVGTGGSSTWNLWQINTDRSITWQTNPPGNWNWVNTYNSSAGQIPLNAWTHIAAVRFGSNFSMYVNGSSVYSTNSFAGAGAGGTLFIGTYYANYNGDGSYFRGNISNFRIVKGTAVYTGNFQLPTVEPTNITNTVLLICRSSTFIDNSLNAVTITPVNSPVISLSNTLLLSAGLGSFPASNYIATIVTPDDFGARPVVWGKTSATSITNKSVSTEQATGIKINVWSTVTAYGSRHINWETMTTNSPYAEGQVTCDETGQPFPVYTRDATVNYGKTQWVIPEPMNSIRGQAITTSTVVIGISVTATYVSTSSRNALPLRPVTFKNLILPVTNDSGGTGNVGTVYGGGPWTFDISGLKSVTEFSVNSIISSTPNVGSAGVGNVVYVAAINTSTKTLTCLSYGYNAPIQGVINSVYNTGEIVPLTRITSVTTVTGSSWFFNITGVRGTNSLVASAGSGTVITVTTASGSTATVGGNSLVVASVDSIDQIKVFAYGGTTPFIGTITGVVSSGTIGTYPIVGDAEFITPGTYTWIAPAGVTSVSAVAVGGGGAGHNTWANAAGAGAGLGWKNNIAVSSGTSYTVQVGAGGVKNGGAGGNSFFINLSTVSGYGGGNATSGQTTSGPNNNGYGGGYIGDGGGAGGNATNYAGGGGAAGYSGNGGNQQNLPTLNSGGAAGGGYYSSTYGSGGGGGVGLWGRAETATGWWHGNSGQAFSTSASNGGGGAGGSGGTRGASGENPLTSTGESGNVNGYGGVFGGGGGGPGTGWPAASGNGGKGGVRIMWGGGRSFPATNAGTFSNIVVLATLTTRSSLIGGPLNDWGTPAATVVRMPYPESIGIDRVDTIVITDTITTDAVQIKLFAFNNLSSFNAGSKSITNSLVGSETFFVAGTGTDGATALSAYWI